MGDSEIVGKRIFTYNSDFLGTAKEVTKTKNDYLVTKIKKDLVKK